MPLLVLPNELLLQIAEDLNSKDLLHFLQANRFLANLLLAPLHKLALLNKGGRPALLWAARRGYEPLVDLLISKGVDVNLTDQLDGGLSYAKGTTALHLAVMKGNIAIVKLLVRHGANIEARNEHGITPFLKAVTRRKMDIIRFLGGELGANVNALDNHGFSALHRQCSEVDGIDIELVKLLLELGADVNLQPPDIERNAALHYAVTPGMGSCSVQALQLLLESGADVNARNDDGETPLFFAASSYNDGFGLSKGLLDAGADVNAQSNDGSSALCYALTWGGAGDVFQLLMNRGADVTFRCQPSGDTALHIAARKHDDAIFRIVLRSTDGIDTQNVFGETALHVAAKRRNGSTVVIKLLLEKGADSSIKNIQGDVMFDLLEWGRQRQLKRWSRLSGRAQIVQR